MELNNKSLFKQKCFINGEWVDSSSKETLEVNNPASLEIIGNVPKCSVLETKKAVDDAIEEYQKRNNLCDFCEEWRSEPGVKILPSEVKGLNDMSINYDTDPDCDI